MSETIVAKTVGNPWNGQEDNPWTHGHPADGERVAIFAFDVINLDGESENIRTYHVAPIDRAAKGAVGPARRDPQGITVQWTGCGTGTVVIPAAGAGRLQTDPDKADAIVDCEVRPDDDELTT